VAVSTDRGSWESRCVRLPKHWPPFPSSSRSPKIFGRQPPSVALRREVRPGRGLERDILHVLNIVASQGQNAQPPRPRRPRVGYGGQDAPPTQGAAASKALREESERLNAPGSDLSSSDTVRRKRAVARRQELQQQLGGQA